MLNLLICEYDIKRKAEKNKLLMASQLTPYQASPVKIGVKGWPALSLAIFKFDKLTLIILRISCANLLSHHSGPRNLPL